MATHSSTLAWKIPWVEEPGRLQPRGQKESGIPFECKQMKATSDSHLP